MEIPKIIWGSPNSFIWGSSNMHTCQMSHIHTRRTQCQMLNVNCRSYSGNLWASWASFLNFFDDFSENAKVENSMALPYYSKGRTPQKSTKNRSKMCLKTVVLSIAAFWPQKCANCVPRSSLGWFWGAFLVLFEVFWEVFGGRFLYLFFMVWEVGFLSLKLVFCFSRGDLHDDSASR